MRKKKWISALLAVIMVITMLPVTVFAADSKAEIVQMDYVPAKEMTVPKSVFGDEWTFRYETPDSIITMGPRRADFQIDGTNKKVQCKVDYKDEKITFTMPWDVDLSKGQHTATFTFFGRDGEARTIHNVQLNVKEDVQGSYSMNQVVQFNTTTDVVLHFQPGTGDNAITSIGNISFQAKYKDESDGNKTTGFTITSNNFTYDLEKGEIYISKDYFLSRVEEFEWEFLSDVYVGTLNNFTLANGAEIKNFHLAGSYPEYGANIDQPIPNDEFVNDNRNYWYLMYTEEASTSLPYTDVSEADWFYDAAKFNYDRGIITGMNEITFAPTVSMTRDHIVTMLYRMDGEPDVSYSPIYPDVPEGIFYTDAVMWGKQTGVATGYENGYFGIGDEITREQTVTMLYRYAQYKNLDVSQRTSLSGYQDGKDVSGFAKDAMEWAIAIGIIKGEDNQNIINPQGTTDRAGGATMIMRFMQYYHL